MMKTILFKITYPDGSFREICAASKGNLIYELNLQGLQGVKIEKVGTYQFLSHAADTEKFVREMQESIRAAHDDIDRTNAKRASAREKARWYTPWHWWAYVDSNY